MSDTFDSDWLYKGHFDLRNDRKGATRTIQVRDALQELTGDQLGIGRYPSSQGSFSHTYYWRGKGDDGNRAQYLANVDEDAPVLFVGLSIEKGQENVEKPMYRLMDRAQWDWPHLAALAPSVLDKSISAIGSALGRPVNVCVYSHNQEREESRTFALVKRAWFERRVGDSSIEELAACLSDVNTKRDMWCDVWIAAAYCPAEVVQFSASDLASILHVFTPLRDQLSSVHR